MRVLGVACASFLLAATVGTGMAQAEEKTKKPDPITVQEQFFKTQDIDNLAEVLPAKIVVADAKAVNVLMPGKERTLGQLLNAHDLEISDYRSEKGKVLDGRTRLEDGVIIFLFKQEQVSSFQEIEIPAPVEEVESSSVEEGTSVVLTEGEVGTALLTTVRTRDLSQVSRLNKKAKRGPDTPTVQTVTVVKAPSPRVILISTGETETPDSSVVSAGGLREPLPGAPISSPFGMRVHPITGVFKLHDGTDFSAPCGTPVFAPTGGTVSRAGDAGAYGNQVEIDHGGGFVTSYSHLSVLSVRAGERVRPGQVVGLVGSTGYSTGCHLHFITEVNGSPVDSQELFSHE